MTPPFDPLKPLAPLTPDAIGGRSLTDVCIRHPVLAWVIMLVVMLFGLVAWRSIGVSQFPDVDQPGVSVNVSWQGASPESVERELIEPLEQALMQVEGVQNLKATAKHGSGSVYVVLQSSRNVDAAMQDVQARVSQVQRRLPEEADTPTVSKSNPDDSPIMWIGLSGAFSPQVLADYARLKIADRLQLIPGVGEVIVGGAQRTIRIWLRPEALVANRVTAAEVVAAIRRNHVELPAGQIFGGGKSVPLRVMGEAATLDELALLRVGGTAHAPLTLSDVAWLEDGFADIDSVAHINGEIGQGIGIKKQRGANALAVGQGIQAAIADLQLQLPDGMSLGINYDSTPFIQESMDALIHEICVAILLTALVCWLFLRSWSSTVNVILAIPMSLLGTVAVTWFLGWTLNTFTLLGLGLAVGIVVDDAILILENIVRRREMGEDAPVAASRGTKEVLFSALVATVAIIAIVLPVIFVRGTFGQFLTQFGVALSIAIAFSYIEAVTLAPSRCARLLRDHRVVTHSVGTIGRGYAALVGWAVRWPWTIVSGAALIFAIGIWGLQALPWETTPSQDVGRLRVHLRAERGAEVRDTAPLVRRAEEIMVNHPAVARSYVAVGNDSGFAYLTLTPRGTRPGQNDVISDLRKQMADIPGLRIGIQDVSAQMVTGNGGYPIDFALLGGNFEVLTAEVKRIIDTMTAEGLARDIQWDAEMGQRELQIIPDRQRCSDLGVSVQQVTDVLQVAMAGVRVGAWSLGGRRIDMRAALVRSARNDQRDMLQLQVRNDQGALVILADVVEVQEHIGLQTITRRERERAVGIDANLGEGRTQGEALQRLRELTTDLPTGVTLRLLGTMEGLEQSTNDFGVAMILGIILAYLILAAQFDSWLHPLTVLSVLPLAAAGGTAALLLTDQSLNVFSLIGFILLMGLAKKNSIVLVDFANREMDAGYSSGEAMCRAAPIRLRPIVMTSIATIAGALPMALGLGAGAEARRPMAIAIVGGMIIATALSLVVVPAVYVLLGRLRQSRHG